MFPIVRYKAYFLLAILPLMSLNSGKLRESELDRLRIENNRLKTVLNQKESKRKIIEAQINYKDSLCLNR